MMQLSVILFNGIQWLGTSLSSVKSWNEIPGARHSSEAADGPVQSDGETFDSQCDDLRTNSNRGEWTGST